MSVGELMESLVGLGVRVDLAGEELVVSAPRGALTPALKQQLKDNKGGLVDLLKRKGAAIAPSPAAHADAARDDEPFPLSDLQVAFQLAADPALEYHVQPHYYTEAEAPGLDLARYQQALNLALARHCGSLVLLTPDRRLREVAEPGSVVCRVNDWRALSAELAHARLAALRARLERTELPLDRWPWFEIEISLWEENGVVRTRIHANFNNFYTDGYGVLLLQRDIDHYYARPDQPLPTLTLRYRDAILALETLGASDAGRRAEEYWQARLPGLPPPPPLPQRRGIERRCRSRLQRRGFTMPASRWRQFKQHCGQHGLTPTSAMIAAYAEVLAAWSGKDHFILSNMATRRLPLHPEMNRIVGNFASLYPLEVSLDAARDFAGNALGIQRQILRDAEHRAYGGMQVMRALNRLHGELGVAPCPYVVGSGLFLEGWKMPDYSCLETAQTLLDHQFWERDDGGMYAVWDLLEQFFPDGMIDAMWEAYRRLIERLADEPCSWSARARALALAPPAPAGLVPPASALRRSGDMLHDTLAGLAVRAGGATAVLSPDWNMSYRELDRYSAFLALRLRRAGVVAGDRVALMAPRGPELVAATLAVLRCAAAYVPVDPQLPPARIAHVLSDSGARVLLADPSLPDGAWPSTVDVVAIEPWSADKELHAAETAGGPGQDPDALAYVIYTSGSTGKPKGVMLDHRSVLNTIVDVNDRFAVGANDVLFGVSSYGFDLSVYDVFGALDAGATLVYPDPAQALNPGHWLELMQRHGVTIWNSAPALMTLLVETAQRRQHTLPALRLVLLSGDWIPLGLPEAVRRIAPHAVVVSLGGATEAAIWSIFHVIDRVDPDWASIPYGKPLANQGWKILDARGRHVPPWTCGELHICGAGLAVGYWGDEARTKASFVVEPDSGEGHYRTGDLGRYLPDGSIEFLGRADAQVKIQGHRIELGEIEAVLCEQAMVRQAVVLAVPTAGTAHLPLPGQRRELLAWVALHEPPEAGAQAVLERHLRSALPAYMVPVHWEFLDELPLSANGKLDRQSLVQLPRRATGSPAPSKSSSGEPQDALTRDLAELCAVVLGRHPIGMDDDFFALGGDSFAAVRYSAMIQERFGATLTLTDIWRARTVAGVARMLAPTAPVAPRLRPLRPEITGRPVFMVHPAGGQSGCYAYLAGLLDRPSHAFVANAADADAGLLDDADTLAAAYVEEMRRVQPDGPYTLAGWSSGGCLAFAMARQLERCGQRVDHVTLIDCPAPGALACLDPPMMLQGFFDDLNLGIRLSDDELAPPVQADVQRFTRIVERVNAGLPRPLAATALFDYYRVFCKIVSAVAACRPGRIDANLLVVRAARGEVAEYAGHPAADLPDWGWAACSGGLVDTILLDADHYSLLRAPALEVLARHMNRREISAAP